MAYLAGSQRETHLLCDIMRIQKSKEKGMFFNHAQNQPVHKTCLIISHLLKPKVTCYMYILKSHTFLAFSVHSFFLYTGASGNLACTRGDLSSTASATKCFILQRLFLFHICIITRQAFNTNGICHCWTEQKCKCFCTVMYIPVSFYLRYLSVTYHLS